MSDFKKEKQMLLERVDSLLAFSKTMEDDTSVYENILSFREEVKDNLTFNVLCLGDFSSGKSTFVSNFFIKKPFLPTDQTETTAKLTVIKYGENEEIHIIYKDGTRRIFSENLDKVLEENIVRDAKYVNDVDYVEVYIQSDFLKEGVVIVDAPGLNAPEMGRMEVTLNYIKNADSILYLLTGMQAWKRSEKEFLEEKILRKEDLDKIFFLINYWDIIDESGRESVLKFVDTQMKKSLDVVSTEIGKDISTPPVIPISAKTGENFDVLYEELWNYLGSKKGQDILLAKTKKVEAIKSSIADLLNEKVEIQKKEKEELTQNLEELKHEIEKYKRDVDKFKHRLEGEVSLSIERVDQ